MDECSNKNHTKIEKRKKKREDKLQKRQKEAFNLVSVRVKTGRNNQTKGKKNNVCIVYFEEVVVANVLELMLVALDVSHFERSLLNAKALLNTDPRSMGTTRQFHNWTSVQTRMIQN